ncbi:MAG: hypothetical protein AABP62_10500 [Planctomycetota bacterium]
MSESIERVVASYLGTVEVDWEKLKPVMCFVVLWNRLEVKHGHHLTINKLETSSASVAAKASFDISRYSTHIAYFRHRYGQSPQLLSSLLRTGEEPVVKKRIDGLIAGTLATDKDNLEALLMIPYRIRNNLFHGRKDTAHLYGQSELFGQVNHVLCLFHVDLP